jgi:hypothetical protein|tara:strand:+ start:541 stop:1632 length:1092 start_codon:yes stop_codon:yes gene_type:complete
MSAENRTVTSIEAETSIRRCFEKKRPVFLWGPPGIGKSELIQSITDEMKGHMIDLRLGQMDPTDIRGIPFYNKDNGTMDWAPPIDLPTKEMAEKYPVIVLFFDEMNSAAPSVQAAAYQLVLNRRIGKYELPDNVVIVAAGNREGDKGVTYRMPSPLSNRFVHIEMRVDFESWQKWAVTNNVHQDVVGYVSFAKQDLFDFDPKSSSRAFATPRSWTFVSDLLGDELDTNTETDLVSGTVGDGTAVKFMAHRKIASQMPNPTDILNGKVKDLAIKEISAMYSLTVSMCYELKAMHESKDKDDKKWHEMVDNFFSYMMANFTTELTVMGARVALTVYNLPFVPNKLKTFDEFHKRFGKYIVQAVGN